MSREAIKLISDGEKEGEGVCRWGKREITYLSLHCHRQNDFCIKMGSDESRFNILLIVRGKIQTQKCTNERLFILTRTHNILYC